jgi:hypothetical protein
MAMLREHDERSGDCLRVALYWQDDDDVLVVEVKDFKNPKCKHGLTGIRPADAKLAFGHRFAWQPSTL